MRTIKQRLIAQPAIEGAGVHLARVFAQNEVPTLDPFLLLDDFSSTDPADHMQGFPWHPHRGIETVTYMLDGEVEHQDSLGNKGVIGPGDVQWMTAGGGIIHQEMPRYSKTGIKGLQLWVNLPRGHKMTQPLYRGITAQEIPKVSSGGVEVAVLSGTFEGTEGPCKGLFVDVRYFGVSFTKEGVFTYDVPEHYTSFVYVLDGTVIINEERVEEKTCAILTNDSSRIEVRSGSMQAHCIVVAGEPIGEPVAWGGPIVMNTQEELQQAFADIENGTFV
jgi:quercetin 2,3-dioxygenase